MSGRFRSLPVAASSMLALALAGCGLNEFEDREAVVSAEGISSVRIIAEAGDLQVLGDADFTEIEMSGRVFARTSAALEGVDFVVTQNGEELLIEILSPDTTVFDAVIQLPDTLDIVIDDASGDIIVEHVGAVDVTDTSGDIDIRDVARVALDDGSGDVRIDGATGGVVVESDTSGNLIIENVDGFVQIVQDTSGDIRIDDVTLDVDIDRDESGDIDIADVGGDVRIASDGSGDIRARRIAGDLTVSGSIRGDITFANVEGTVTIP